MAVTFPRLPGSREHRRSLESGAGCRREAMRQAVAPIRCQSRRQPDGEHDHREPGVPMEALPMRRCDSVCLVPDPRRVITKLFMPADEVARDGSSRLEALLDRIMALTDDEVTDGLADARALFSSRHRDFDAVLDRHHDVVAARFDGRSPFTSPFTSPIPEERRRLIGAYFTHEYSIEAAALGNPSIVVAPDQSGVAAGAVRFVMSLRAIGEGHVSSIEFRTGVVDADGTVELDPVSSYAETGVRSPHAYDKGFFSTKLADLAMLNEVEERVLARLSERFTMSELESAIAAARRRRDRPVDVGRDDPVPALARVVELSGVVPTLDRDLRARVVPERPDREPRDGGRPLRPLRRRRRDGHLLRHLHRVRRPSDTSATHRDR